MVFNCYKAIGFSVNVHPINNVVKQHLKIVLGIIKNHSTTFNIMIRNYQQNCNTKNTWKIVRICCLYNPNCKRCLLCLNEKYKIVTYKGYNLLNKITEIINSCRYRGKYKLANCETIDYIQCLVLSCNVILCKLIQLTNDYMNFQFLKKWFFIINLVIC